MNKVSARKKLSKQPARKAPKPGTTPVDRRLLASAKREEAEGVIPPGPAEFMRKQLRGVPRQQALSYLDSLLEHARDLVIESLPKLVRDIKTEQHHAALSAFDAIEAVRHGLRLLGGES